MDIGRKNSKCITNFKENCELLTSSMRLAMFCFRHNMPVTFYVVISVFAVLKNPNLHLNPDPKHKSNLTIIPNLKTSSNLNPSLILTLILVRKI